MGEILEKSWRSACYNGELGEVKQMFKSVSPTFREVCKFWIAEFYNLFFFLIFLIDYFKWMIDDIAKFNLKFDDDLFFT